MSSQSNNVAFPARLTFGPLGIFITAARIPGTSIYSRIESAQLLHMGTPLILAKEAKMQPHPFLSFLAFPLPFFSFHLFPVLLSAFGHNKLVISSSLLCETRKSAAQNSEDNWKHSCFRRTAAHRDFFDYCPLSYLLTYFLHSHFLSLSLLHSPPCSSLAAAKRPLWSALFTKR